MCSLILEYHQSVQMLLLLKTFTSKKLIAWTTVDEKITWSLIRFSFLSALWLTCEHNLVKALLDFSGKLWEVKGGESPLIWWDYIIGIDLKCPLSDVRTQCINKSWMPRLRFEWRDNTICWTHICVFEGEREGGIRTREETYHHCVCFSLEISCMLGLYYTKLAHTSLC